VEDWVHRRAWRESQLVGDGADLVDDLERPKIFEAQLVVGARS
jgi:hypothetical protein